MTKKMMVEFLTSIGAEYDIHNPGDSKGSRWHITYKKREFYGLTRDVRAYIDGIKAALNQ